MPVTAGYAFERVRSWVKGVGQQLASTYPELIATAHRSTHRGRRVTIDDALNSVGRNTTAPYTLRASPAQPTVTTPLTCEELDAGNMHPIDLTPQVVLERVGRLGDLFAPVLQANQHIASFGMRKLPTPCGENHIYRAAAGQQEQSPISALRRTMARGIRAHPTETAGRSQIALCDRNPFSCEALSYLTALP